METIDPDSISAELLDRDDENEPVQTVPPVVAVMVTNDAGPWFEESLAALGTQDYPSLSVLVLDNGSGEDPTDRIAGALPGAFVRHCGGNGEMDCEMELTALPGFALHPHSPLHQLGKLLANRQPKTGAAETPRQGVIRLPESLEDMLLLRGWDAHARIGDAELQFDPSAFDRRLKPAATGV